MRASPKQPDWPTTAVGNGCLPEAPRACTLLCGLAHTRHRHALQTSVRENLSPVQTLPLAATPQRQSVLSLCHAAPVAARAARHVRTASRPGEQQPRERPAAWRPGSRPRRAAARAGVLLLAAALPQPAAAGRLCAQQQRDAIMTACALLHSKHERLITIACSGGRQRTSAPRRVSWRSGSGSARWAPRSLAGTPAPREPCRGACGRLRAGAGSAPGSASGSARSAAARHSRTCGEPCGRAQPQRHPSAFCTSACDPRGRQASAAPVVI